MARKKKLVTAEFDAPLEVLRTFLRDKAAGKEVSEAMLLIEKMLASIRSLEEANINLRNLLRKAWKIEPGSEKSDRAGNTKNEGGQGKEKSTPSNTSAGQNTGDDSPKKKAKALRGGKALKTKLLDMRGRSPCSRKAAQDKKKMLGSNSPRVEPSAGKSKAGTNEQSNEDEKAMNSDSNENPETLEGLPVAKASDSILEPMEAYFDRMKIYGTTDDDDSKVDEITRDFEDSTDIVERTFLQSPMDLAVRTICQELDVPFSGKVPLGEAEDFNSLEEEAIAIFCDPRASANVLRKKSIDEGRRVVDEAPIAPLQNLFEHDITDLETDTITIPLSESDKKQVVSRTHEVSTKIDVQISVKAIKYRREIGFDAVGKRIVPPLANSAGPKGMRCTWTTLVTVATLIVKFVFPLSRVTKLMSSLSKQFSRSSIWNMLAYVGETLLPAYLGLIQESAIYAEYFHADDSDAVTRTTIREAAGRSEQPEESTKAFENKNLGKKSIKKITDILPYRNKKIDGKTDKEKLHVSVVIGRISPKTNDSWSFVYYTHFGSVGDVLSHYLKTRFKKRNELSIAINKSMASIRSGNLSLGEINKLKQQIQQHRNEWNKIPESITVVRDQSSQNTPRIPRLFGFSVKTAGCLMHARRKFRHPTNDERVSSHAALFCEVLISMVYRVEAWLTLAGRTIDRVRRIRERYNRPLLSSAKKFAEAILDDTEEVYFSKAAEYFIKHEKDLCAHIEDPFIPPDSGLPERAIRTKKLFARSSFGHETRRGTICYDIIRSVMATCIACKVSYTDYFLWVAFKREELGDVKFHELDPLTLTPRAYKLFLETKDKPGT